MTALPKSAPAVTLPERTDAALERACGFLIERQHPDGWWKGELSTNVTMDAEDLLLRQFLGILRPDELAETARWIRSQQRADGTWASFPGGPGDLSTTIEAYAALRLAGDECDAPHLVAAARFVRERGGIGASRVFTRIWLALFGEWPWDRLPAMPPELVLLPSWVPLNIYDWACWARQTVVPITVVATLRPVRPLPFDLAELHRGPRRAPRAHGVNGLLFGVLDTALSLYGRLPVQPGREIALRRAAEWIIARQESDGGWGGIQPPWVYSILALHLLGHRLDSPELAAAIGGLEGFLVREQTPDGPVRRLEACQSPVWDTCLALTALLDAGAAGSGSHADTDTDSHAHADTGTGTGTGTGTDTERAIGRAADWLLGEEIRCTGDWAVRRPGLPPGGWAFEFANDCYPDIDDTAEVVLALDRVAPRPGLGAALQRGVDWTIGMQCRDGGWAAFDADNTRRLVERLPFCDFGAVIDPPSADVTAHVVEMLAARGLAGGDACRRGVRWLLAAQEPDGSWFGRWGANHVYGTGAVLPALVAAGVAPSSPPVLRALDWLAAHQNPDGGWGEDMRSYRDPAWRGRGTSTPSQTAWALLALLAADPGSEAGERGVRWLLDTQRDDGGWDEAQHTGTGFPGDFFISYGLYRDVFPISALGRYRRAAD